MNIFKDNLFLWFLLFLAVVAPSFFFGAIHLVALILFAFVLLLIIGGIVIRWKLYKIQKSARAAQQAFYQDYQQQGNNTAEGDVKIYKTEASSEKKIANDVGDYVDFEEIKK